MKLSEEELIKLPFEQRVKYAPYSIWIPSYNRSEFHPDSLGSGSYRIDGVDYTVLTCSNCNGDREDVSISTDCGKHLSKPPQP